MLGFAARARDAVRELIVHALAGVEETLSLQEFRKREACTQGSGKELEHDHLTSG